MRKLLVCLFALLVLQINPTTSFAGNAQQAVAACVACHGDKGNSLAPIFPKLAGQNKKYLAKQLIDFKLHKRKNPTMEGLAGGLDDQTIEEIAAYYSRQKATITPAAETDENEDEDEDSDEALQSNPEDLLEKGRNLYLYGNLGTKVPACSTCHAPNAMGNPLAGFPVLKNQHATYLVTTLKQFRDGERKNDTNGMMHMSAKKMSAEEINAVSAYLASLK